MGIKGYYIHSFYLFIFLSMISLHLSCATECEPISDDRPLKYEPTWASLDQRPLPTWYDEAKLGIFICLGVYSVPAYQSEWFWYNWEGRKSPSVQEFMKDNYRPNFTYADFAPDLSAAMFDPDEWTEVIRASGAK